MLTRFVTAATLALLIFSGRLLLADEKDKAAKDGWWIKIKLDKTECNEITFDIGVNKESAKSWKTWKKGEPTEFDVPAEFKQVGELYIHATVHPEGKNGWFCMMYKNNGVKHFDFDKDEDHQKKQSDTDDECK